MSRSLKAGLTSLSLSLSRLVSRVCLSLSQGWSHVSLSLKAGLTCLSLYQGWSHISLSLSLSRLVSRVSLSLSLSRLVSRVCVSLSLYQGWSHVSLSLSLSPTPFILRVSPGSCTSHNWTLCLEMVSMVNLMYVLPLLKRFLKNLWSFSPKPGLGDLHMAEKMPNSRKKTSYRLLFCSLKSPPCPTW